MVMGVGYRLSGEASTMEICEDYLCFFYFYFIFYY
jgi:hypothetical protein